MSQALMTGTTLAFRIGVEKAKDGTVRSCTVKSVVPGSVADLYLGMQVGDFIHAVEDSPITSMTEEELIERMYGDGCIGTKCRLTVQNWKTGEVRDVEIRRTNASAASETEDFFLLARDHAQLIYDGVESVDLEYSLRLMLNQAINIERFRIINEQSLSAKLKTLQTVEASSLSRGHHQKNETGKAREVAILAHSLTLISRCVRIPRKEIQNVTSSKSAQGTPAPEKRAKDLGEDASLDSDIAHAVNELLVRGVGGSTILQQSED
eukprot:762556-Hanusia_phi.AAC.1